VREVLTKERSEIRDQLEKSVLMTVKARANQEKELIIFPNYLRIVLNRTASQYATSDK
jgi:hypothetical protein